ncbi:hypothetical protein MKZ38_004701 [Zalerion maritima]|uniref:AAA+ ATPase domain-containing protein n=1 Tax=Zalerion maritima TaxID=339359 RepID=A0AAD5WPE2_9PEZI|nr:hypothetical protein MKZ38_004701 [Zalerion maritima]
MEQNRAGASSVSPEDVQAIVDSCNVSQDRARALLQKAGNNVEKAKQHHAVYSRYMPGPSASSPAKPRGPFLNRNGQTPPVQIPPPPLRSEVTPGTEHGSRASWTPSPYYTSSHTQGKSEALPAAFSGNKMSSSPSPPSVPALGSNQSFPATGYDASKSTTSDPSLLRSGRPYSPSPGERRDITPVGGGPSSTRLPTGSRSPFQDHSRGSSRSVDSSRHRHVPSAVEGADTGGQNQQRPELREYNPYSPPRDGSPPSEANDFTTPTEDETEPFVGPMPRLHDPYRGIPNLPNDVPARPQELPAPVYEPPPQPDPMDVDDDIPGPRDRPRPDIIGRKQVAGGSERAESPVEPEAAVQLREDEEDSWDFTLPRLPSPGPLSATNADGVTQLSIEELTGAIQDGVEIEKVQNYLNNFSRSQVARYINQEIMGIPPMFYAVGTNDEAVIRLFASYGGDISAVHPSSKLPLLAFAILNSEVVEVDTTLAVATLLSLGAPHEVIPRSFFSPSFRDLPEMSEDDEEVKALRQDFPWCRGRALRMLRKTTNLTQRYFLERASNTKKPSVRHRQVARRRNAETLLGIPYFLIGQRIAARGLVQKLLSYLTLPHKRPLVLAFAGPSGHGKTELARRLGHLLSLELEVVDCTIVNREMELFGPRRPYSGADRGSPLNNFIARNAGRRCIVFLDEFEKTTAEIHQSLLLPFDNGEYQDRRNLDKIDCSKTIWILATNALDATIQDFCSTHKVIFADAGVEDKALAPITGRVSEFIPFLPFSAGEQAVVVHKFLLELAQNVRAPVDLREGPSEQLLGNVRLRVWRDAAVCRSLAQEGYSADLGARSLSATVSQVVEDMLVDAYLDGEGEIVEGDDMRDFVVDVADGEVTVNLARKPAVAASDAQADSATTVSEAHGTEWS